MKSVASLSAAVALLSGSADAFWRMPCHSRTALARLDPIVDKGVASSHGHVIHGGSNFDESTTYDDLRASECTSCQFTDDKSAYWTPSLHFVHASGKVEIVPQVGGMLAYYLLLGDNLKAFPKGFQMLAGDSRMRNFTGPKPDPPTSAWGLDDMTQESLMQKSLGFNCLNYAKAPEGSRYRHFLPDKQYLDDNCADGIRAELFFPSCWNGKDAKADDHKSHMAYPNLIDGGKCPEGFDTRVPSLFYETIWNTYKFKGQDGQFVWSNGDPTGYGYHGDFMNGWDIDVLQSAVSTCTNPSGRTEDCPVFSNKLQSEPKMGQCEIQNMPKMLEHDDCAGPAKGLCGNVPVQYGPGYANPLNPGSGEKPTVKPIISSVAPVPTQSYAPARSEGAGGISVFNVKEKPSAVPAPDYPVNAPPMVTAAPAKQEVDDAVGGKIVSTTTYTSGGIVYEVAIEEVAVTVTVTDTSAKKHRRHANAHLRKRGGARA
ncbi:hypothetical protein DE146DRAFT_2465 [Phaeosphaeria sp. MPI-PUGE-AT-0046c]|nr:hypothetical protein DE146DRAFT_2465 [Phaeosphaeria sp. MPI-PUGE-AT-0046c]